jgi:hypothetical protein
MIFWKEEEEVPEILSAQRNASHPVDTKKAAPGAAPAIAAALTGPFFQDN